MRQAFHCFDELCSVATTYHTYATLLQVLMSWSEGCLFEISFTSLFCAVCDSSYLANAAYECVYGYVLP